MVRVEVIRAFDGVRINFVALLDANFLDNTVNIISRNNRVIRTVSNQA